VLHPEHFYGGIEAAGARVDDLLGGKSVSRFHLGEGDTTSQMHSWPQQIIVVVFEWKHHRHKLTDWMTVDRYCWM
jgi:hypothetical protein